MIKAHRKYHFVIWHLLAVVLPLCFVMGIAVRPSPPARTKFEEGVLRASIVPGTDSTDEITIEVAGALTEPSNVVMLSGPRGEVVLGTLDHQRHYTFIVRKVDLPTTLKLWDAINHKSIDSLSLTEKK